MQSHDWTATSAHDYPPLRSQRHAGWLGLLLWAPLFCAHAAAPTAALSLDPSSLRPGDWVVVTLRVQAGTAPASTGLSAKADLSGLGRSVAQDLFDDGRYGDAVAGDGLFSYRENIASALSAGSVTVRAWVTDAQGRRAESTQTVSIVTGDPAPPPNTGLSLSSTPVAAEAGQSIVLSAVVTAASNPTSTRIRVNADLRQIGGRRSQRFSDDGSNGDLIANDDRHSFAISLPSSLTAGDYRLPITVSDRQGRSGSSELLLTVSTSAPPPPPPPAPTAPSGTAQITPQSQQAGQSILLQVSVTPGSQPSSTGLQVLADLGALGGSVTAALNDSGQSGDASAGDLVFSLSTEIAAATPAASYTLRVTIRDAEGRQGLAFANLSVTAPTPPPPPPGHQHACSGFYDSSFSFVEGLLNPAIPSAGRPPKGSAYADLSFGSCGVRATDHATEPPSSFARNDYSRRQAFNADNSRFLVFSLNGFWHQYDANTLAYIGVLPGLAGDAEPQWHPTDPSKLYYVQTNGGTDLRELDVVSGSTRIVTHFAGRLPWNGVAHIWTKSEGSPSADGRYWCLMAENSSFSTLGVFVYDLQSDSIVGSKSISARPDHVSMSASGRWCVISHLAGSGGTVAWSRDFGHSVPLHSTSEHSDLALSAEGHDIFVAVDYQSNDGAVFMLDIDTGQRTDLFSSYSAGAASAFHFSGKSFDRPGWVLVSSYAGYGPRQWYMEKLFAMELRASPRIFQLAHHHSAYNGYWTEPHASVSRDFRRILFNSNWGTTSATDLDAYMIHLPAEGF
ncbi:choice-of-anchor X domain-containing protein [Pseudomarimonas arenosa]|uniref:Uncharacterized protein n=1 Tax=Pseudomarimonas arenosa TaxID=2774145 RepID=A0AAW3ZFL0_9GAMM|nr:choice-of-anchor X domain-containing protein [Pseudomarimonas arenosa]MBD8524836.1 hypothetical protein [Pseudomarimonas arenosa]